MASFNIRRLSRRGPAGEEGREEQLLARARAEGGRRYRGGGTGIQADGPAAWGGILLLRAAVKSLSMYLLLWPASDAMESPAPDAAKGKGSKSYRGIAWRVAVVAVMAVVVMR